MCVCVGGGGGGGGLTFTISPRAWTYDISVWMISLTTKQHLTDHAASILSSSSNLEIEQQQQQ